MGQAAEVLTLVPAVAAAFFAPGLAWSVALLPRVSSRDGFAETIGLALLLSLLITGGLGLTLAVSGVLNPPVTAAAFVAVTAAGAAVGLRRSGRPALRLSPVPVIAPVAGIFLLVLLGTVWAPELRLPQRDGMPTSGVTWYYWDLADQIAREGGLPGESLEWGRAQPYPTTYLFFSAATAAYEQLTTADVRAQMEAFRLSLLAAALVFGWLFYRRLLEPPGAAAALVLTFAGYFLLNRFSAYRPESFGITLALAGAWCLLGAVGYGQEAPARRLYGVTAALAFGVAYLSHAIPLTAVALLMAGLLIAGLVLGELGALRRLALAAAIGVGAAAIGGGVTLAIDRELPLLRAAAPAAIQDGVDLTWQVILATEGATEYRPPPDFEAMLDRAAREPWERLDFVSHPYLLALFVLPFAAWRGWTGPERRLALGALLFAGLLAGLVFGFYLAYDTYVPARTGPDRLAPYGVFALAPLGALGLVGAARAAASLGARPRSSSSAAGTEPARDGAVYPLLVAGAVIALTGLVLFPTARGLVRRLDRQSITPEAYEALRWLDDNLPSDAVLLANSYTDGSLNGIVHRLGVINGRVPFQAVPEFRDEAIALLIRARRFFGDPTGERTLLADYGVTHVLVARKTWVLGGSPSFPANEQALRNQPGVRLLREFPRLNVYEVAGPARPPVVPDTSRRDALPWLMLAWMLSGGVAWGLGIILDRISPRDSSRPATGEQLA